MTPWATSPESFPGTVERDLLDIPNIKGGLTICSVSLGQQPPATLSP